MRDQISVMDRLLHRTGGQGYIYCLKVIIIHVRTLCLSNTVVWSSTEHRNTALRLYIYYRNVHKVNKEIKK